MFQKHRSRGFYVALERIALGQWQGQGGRESHPPQLLGALDLDAQHAPNVEPGLVLVLDFAVDGERLFLGPEVVHLGQTKAGGFFVRAREQRAVLVVMVKRDHHETRTLVDVAHGSESH